MSRRLKGGPGALHAAVLSKTKRTLKKRLMQVVTLFMNFLEDRSPSGKVDMSGSRVAALHYVEDCINRHIRG